MDPYGAEEFEAHVVDDTSIGESYDALLDFTTIHTILQDKQFLMLIIFQLGKPEI